MENKCHSASNTVKQSTRNKWSASTQQLMASNIASTIVVAFPKKTCDMPTQTQEHTNHSTRHQLKDAST